jgi:hypothetical protein
MRHQVLFFLFVSLVIFITRSASAGFLDDLKDTLEGAVGEIEEPFDAKKKDPGLNQEKKPAESSSTSPKNGKDIASSNAIINFFCPPPKEPEKLPKDMAGLESDFGKSASELADIFKNNNQAKIPFILNLKQYNNAFDGPEIKEVFNNFVDSRDPRYLALIREASLKNYSPMTWVRKADAMFAYGLVHVYYQNVGGNAEKGYKLIKKAANGENLKKGRDEFLHTQYGATYIEGTRQYNGYGKDINLSKATTYMNKAYEVARNRSDNLAKTVQAEFLRLILEPDFPHPKLFANLAKGADSMRQTLEQEFSSSARSANPVILQKSQKLAVMRNNLLAEIGSISGMGKDLEEFKVRAKQLASQANPTNSVVKETIILGDGFTKKLEKRMGSLKKLDEDGLIKLEAVHQENENLLYATGELAIGWFSYQAFQMSSGGASLNLFETVEILRNLDGMTNRMCSVRKAIIGFAERTEVTINSETEFQYPEGI